MIGQQLDLFGAPLRPPKKILVDEPAVDETPASTDEDPTQETATVSNESEEITNAINAEEAPIAENAVAEETVDETVAEAAPMPEAAGRETPDTPEPEINVESYPAEVQAEVVEEEAEEIPASIEEMDEQVALKASATEEDQPLEEEEDKEIETAEVADADSTESLHEHAPKLESIDQQQVVYRGRKTGDPEEEMEMLNVPPDEALFKRQYYSMRETAAMFNVNQALLRFWENEFDILQPKKNKKGDRYFRPIDIKNLVLIYHLLRVRKFTMEGAKDYLQTHQKAADSFQLVQRLEKIKTFLVELKANL